MGELEKPNLSKVLPKDLSKVSILVMPVYYEVQNVFRHDLEKVDHSKY